MPTLPSPPFIEVPGIHNFRSIGAHSTSTSSLTRATYIYRSGSPHTIALPHGPPLLQSLRISTVYDLRSQPEIDRVLPVPPLPPIPGITRVFNPVFDEANNSPERLAGRYRAYAAGGTVGFVTAYADILDAGKPAFARMFRHILERPGEVFLVHCTAGKDRTGVFVALVLSLAGVADERVAEEYGLTELGLEEWVVEVRERLLRLEGFEGGDEAVRNMTSAHGPNMLATLEMIRERYGGAEGYVRNELGFTEEEIDTIRRHIVEDAEP